jgi:hypothetical protein
MYVTINQAVNFWHELVGCYYSDNGFGGDTAEIYIHTMMEHSNSYAQKMEGNSSEEARRNACQAMYNLCKKFEALYNCKVEFADGASIEVLNQQPLSWRIHLKVVRGDQNGS